MRQRMGQQIISPSIDGLLGHYMPSIGGQRLNSICNSRRTGRQRQSCYASLQCRNPLFQDLLGRIRKTAIDIARLFQSKPRRRMGRVLKYIRSRLVNRYGSCIRRRIWLLLSYMKLKSLKFVFAHVLILLV